MYMQRQKEQKQQGRRPYQPAPFSCCSSAKNCHGIEANRRLLPCQPTYPPDPETLPKQLHRGGRPLAEPGKLCALQKNIHPGISLAVQ
jgi:hypothetical protein